MRCRGFLGGLLLALLVQVLFVEDARAYLDPGTGSLIIQAIIAAFLGTAFTVKLYWKRIKTYLSRGKATPPSSSAPANEGDPGHP